jgi:translation initiation factor IF-2
MAEVTVSEFAKVLKVPVDRLLVQLDEAGIKVGGADDLISDDAKLELLTHLRKSHGRKEAAQSAPSRITLNRKQNSELKLAAGQGRSRTINVEVRQKRTYVKRDVLEEQARKQQEELDALRRADEEAKTAAEREEREKREAEERERHAAELREAEEKRRLEEESRRAAAADQEARTRAEAERQRAAVAEKEAAQKAENERARQKVKKEKIVDEPVGDDHTLHVADGMSGRRRKKKQRRRSVQVTVDSQHAFERPTAPVVREVEIGQTITVGELASRMAVKANEVI